MRLGPLFTQERDDDDLASGTVYVLRSKSNHPVVASNRDVLHKVGVTGGKIDTRISNDHLDPTFLMADVEVIAILLKASIVNHGPDEVTIPACQLEIRLGDFIRIATSADIPATWRIKRREQGALGFIYKETPVTPELTQHDKYPKGIPHVGWMVFELPAWGHPVFPNAAFTLLLQDSFGNVHRIRREPQVYLQEGQIVSAAQTNPPMQGLDKIK